MGKNFSIPHMSSKGLQNEFILKTFFRFLVAECAGPIITIKLRFFIHERMMLLLFIIEATRKEGRLVSQYLQDNLPFITINKLTQIML
jgi:hypothetical protein